MHYKIIFLIIASTDVDVYIQMKYLSKYYYNLYSDYIKIFYVENKEDMINELVEYKNNIYVKGTESFIPGIYNKSVKSMKYIINNYSCDFIIRTNLSTVWHMDNLISLLDTKPKEKFGGGYSFQGFTSGTGIIMSRDVAEYVSNNYNSANIGDDLAISQSIQNFGVTLCDVTEYKWGFLIPRQDSLPSNCRYVDINETDFSDILNFRIKNSQNRLIDIDYFKVLLNKLYNIDINIVDPILPDEPFVDQPIIEETFNHPIIEETFNHPTIEETFNHQTIEETINHLTMEFNHPTIEFNHPTIEKPFNEPIIEEPEIRKVEVFQEPVIKMQTRYKNNYLLKIRRR